MAVQAMLDVPERNFLIAGSLGLIVAVSGWLLRLIANAFFPDESLDPLAYDEGPTLPFAAVPGPGRQLAPEEGVRLPFLPRLSGLTERLRAVSLPARPSPRPAPAGPEPEPEPEVGGVREDER